MTLLPRLFVISLAVPALTVGPAACDGEGDDGGDDVAAADDGDDESGGVAGECADADAPDAPVQTISGDIDGGAQWGCETVYLLDGPVFVNGGTLTIAPGTTVRGTAGAALVISADASLDAQGTPDAPIIMTSALPQGERNRGDWGGLILIGKAPNNLDGGVGAAEGFATPPQYGGTDAGHTCGHLSYLRVEWAGFELSAGNELNGITFYSCGSGTTVDHVQVHMGQDDGIEMFGGNFDANHIVITGAADDSLDCDEGYRGNLEHVFIQQDPTVGDNCLEWSNQGADFTAQPVTGPSVAHLTCIGSGPGGGKSKGMTLKEGTDAGIYNSIFTDITNEGVLVTHAETQARAEAGGLVLEGNLWFGHNGFAVGEGEEATMWTADDLATWLMDNGNVDGVDPGLPSTAWGAPNIRPAGDSAAAGGGDAYIGAVDPAAAEDWTQAGWINYSAK